ncbi:class II fructose-bisphosphate aldolase [Eubacterium barkeri]|uniref:Tagatose 1,6-diphosphate aldolase GatY/KbaY n=1 Tax=Eubacterium barkeri TaxID=1528 RepID=A0A1H3FZS9_EUBBA|nr:class II fructose-bisphosphate aldolase [Eubacterium barkeri]SDX96582.1 tagatose 1,6-diphosphate aldolase GatY/KbaY [Eubacterium barkeri]
MLVNSKEILNDAKKGGYAVPAPDFLDLDMARTFVQTAEAEGKPVILSFAQAHQDVISLEEAAVIGKLVGEAVSVPVVLHLDHGQDLEFLERAMDLGFTSVMIDASSKPFEENVAITKAVVALAHPRGITVEAEIGHVGQGDAFGGGAEGQKSDSIYTSVAEAVAFVEQTDVDSLAVSIGTCHGLYAGNTTPVLNFERLKELAAAVPVPLVLHGSSGSGDDNIHRCATEGIAKINIFTDFLVGATKEIHAQGADDFLAMKRAANTGMAAVLKHNFDNFI